MGVVWFAHSVVWPVYPPVMRDACRPGSNDRYYHEGVPPRRPHGRLRYPVFGVDGLGCQRGEPEGRKKEVVARSVYDSVTRYSPFDYVCSTEASSRADLGQVCRVRKDDLPPVSIIVTSFLRVSLGRQGSPS